jgi:hypothetical protein
MFAVLPHPAKAGEEGSSQSAICIGSFEVCHVRQLLA